MQRLGKPSLSDSHGPVFLIVGESRLQKVSQLPKNAVIAFVILNPQSS